MRTNGVPFFTSHEGQTRFSLSGPLIQAIEFGCERIDADLLSDPQPDFHFRSPRPAAMD
jgi:hypothetical protein